MEKRSVVYVCDDGKRIATVSGADDISSERGQAVKMWRVKMHHKQFDPFQHEHEEHEEKPYVASDEEGRLSLVNPKPMGIVEARQWVRDNYIGRKRTK